MKKLTVTDVVILSVAVICVAVTMAVLLKGAVTQNPGHVAAAVVVAGMCIAGAFIAIMIREFVALVHYDLRIIREGGPKAAARKQVMLAYAVFTSAIVILAAVIFTQIG